MAGFEADVIGGWSSRPTACCSVPVPTRHTSCSLARLSPTHQPIFATVTNTTTSSSAQAVTGSRNDQEVPAEPPHDTSTVTSRTRPCNTCRVAAPGFVLTQLSAGRHRDQRLPKDLLLPAEHGLRAAPVQRRTHRHQTFAGQSGQ
jgi:hypothetical protein